MDLVADLLSKPFSRRAFQEKLDNVKQGRATPKLASLSQPGKGFVRHFQSTNYERSACYLPLIDMVFGATLDL